MNSSLKTWLLASRPKTLFAAISPVLIGSSMAFADNGFHWISALAALLGALAIQIGTNFANDYYDFVKGADTCKRSGPTRATQAGLVTAEQMKKTFIMIFLLAFLIGGYLVWRGGWPIVLIGILAVASGILYTGGPYPLGYLGLGDVFVFIFFGPVAVAGTYFVQTGEVTFPVLLAGVGPGLIAVAILTVNNLRDMETDREAGKKTLAVRFGKLFTRLEYFFCLFLSSLVPVIIYVNYDGHPVSMVALVVFILAIPSIQKVFKSNPGNQELNQVLANTGKLLFFYSTIFSIGWLI